MTRDAWPNLRGVHVFVIDDNEDSRRLLEQALEYCGGLVTVFSSAEAALDAMNEYLPTLIISDISMPQQLSGLEFTRRLRARPPDKGALIPVIAVTAYYEDFAAAATRAAGFQAYLTKPLNFETLCILVDDVVSLTR